MSSDPEIIEVCTAKMMNRFIRFPHKLYEDDINYVPLPNLFVKNLLSPRQNPFFKKGEVACFLVIDRQNKILGRIAAVYNAVHLSVYNDKTGFFGLFDCINDKAVAATLLNTASEWLKKKGLTKMTGPVSLTTNDTTGILTRGFSDSPVFMMPYNFPYYERLLRANGFSEAMTLFSYNMSHETLPADIYKKAELIEHRLRFHQVGFRHLNLQKFHEEITRLRPVYNKVNERNWGFMPLDEDAFSYMANDLKKLVDKDSVLLAEHNDELIGFAVSMPDYNLVFKKMKTGQLFPFGWWHLIAGSRKINRFRVVILGVLPRWRGFGIDWCLYARIAAYAKKRNFNSGEACYVMKDNSAMNKMMKALGSTVTKEYKLYQRAI